MKCFTYYCSLLAPFEKDLNGIRCMYAELIINVIKICGYRYLDDFRRGISVFAIFSSGIAVLGTPQSPPPREMQRIAHRR